MDLWVADTLIGVSEASNTALCVARHRRRSDADRPVDEYTLRMTTPEDAETGLAANKRSDSTASGVLVTTEGQVPHS